MTLFSQWIELIITQDSGYFVNVCTSLRNAGIAYKEKSQGIGHGNRRHGQIGSLGENTNYSNMYQVFVKKADLGYAKALITQQNHQHL